MANNNKNAALVVVDRILGLNFADCENREVLANEMRDDADGFVAWMRLTARLRQEHNISVLSDEEIIQKARDFIAAVPNIIDRNQRSSDSVSSISNEHGSVVMEGQERQEDTSGVAMEAPRNIGHEGNQESEELRNQGAVESVSSSKAAGNSPTNPQILHPYNISSADLNETSTSRTTGTEASIGTAEVAGHAFRALYHGIASNFGSDPTVRDLEPYPIRNENAHAVSSPHLEQQTENDDSGSMCEQLVASTVLLGRAEHGEGNGINDEHYNDKKPSTKKC